MVMVWKTSLSTIIGGAQEPVSVKATKPRTVGGGQPLSYNSPKRVGNALNESMSRANNVSRVGGSPIRSPFRSGGNNVNSSNAVDRSHLAGLSGNNTGKEFVLEELTSGDVGDSDLLTGNVPQSSDAPPLNKEQLPEVLAGTLDHIVGQLDGLTRTMALLDKRLSLQEDMMARYVYRESEEGEGK